MLRLLTSLLALGALVLLSLHPMTQPDPNDVIATATHIAHGVPDRGASDVTSACAIHCLAAALLPATRMEGALSLRRVGVPFEASVQPAGLSPPPIGPPPKVLVFL